MREREEIEKWERENTEGNESETGGREILLIYFPQELQDARNNAGRGQTSKRKYACSIRIV